MIAQYVIRDINPEPWTSPSASASRIGGRVVARVHKNARLRAYQEAIKEALEGVDEPRDGPVDLEFYFWRQLEQYKTDKDKLRRRNRADVTNLQKALEDAIQGILITNDRNVVSITSVMVEQGPDVVPRIGIMIHVPSLVSPERINERWENL